MLPRVIFTATKQYLKDTAQVNDKGFFVFKGNESLAGGVYMVVLPPDNQFIQLMVNEGEQNFSVETNMSNLVGAAEIKNSRDNQLFFEYLSFLAEQRPKAEALRKEKEAVGQDEAKGAKITEQLDQIDQEVRDFQMNLMKKNPNSLTAAIIQSNQPVDLPEFEGTEEEIQLKQWQYTKSHYFDNIDLTDPRMLRTPFLYQKVDYLIDKLTVQHPDSIAKSIDFILKKLEPAEETYKYYLVHFLNEYAKSKVVGFDAVYVHLALNYYKTGKAPWTDEDQLKKIVENGEKTGTPINWENCT